MTSIPDLFTRPCPNPACPPVLDQASAYVRTKLGGVFLPDYAALFATPAYHQVRSEIGRAMAAGDLDATKVACRCWCKLVLTWTRSHREVGATDPVREEPAA